MKYLSLFSGIEAATQAWHPLGWTPVAFSEIEKFPCAVLAHHYPDVPNLGDITKITEADIKALGHIDLVVGGFPCQDLSIAGKRKGLKNHDGTSTRSGLFFDAMRIIRWANPRWTVIENVPGLYSSNGGRDFAAVVGEMVGSKFGVPRNGWRTAGTALGPSGLCEWRCLDAQFFGVPQRRRRVFLVRDIGDWASRAPIFLIANSLQGHPAPGRKAGKSVAALTANGVGTCGADDNQGQAGHLIAKVYGGNNASGPIDVAPACNAHPSGRQDFESEAFVTHILRGEGFDASEDGTGRGTPLVPVGVTIHGTDKTKRVMSYTDVSGALRTKPPGSIENSSSTAVLQPVAFQSKASASQSKASASQSKASASQSMNPATVTPALDVGKADGMAVAYDMRGREGGAMLEGPHDTANIRAASGGSSRSYVANQMQVRRLTPVECERLQGFPEQEKVVDISIQAGKIVSCLDHPRNYVNAATRCHRLQNSAVLVEGSKLPEYAKSVMRSFCISQASQRNHVVVSAQINYEAGTLQILNGRNECLFSAKIAEPSRKDLRALKIEDFVQSSAEIVSCVDRMLLDGKAELVNSTCSSTKLKSGKSLKSEHRSGLNAGARGVTKKKCLASEVITLTTSQNTSQVKISDLRTRTLLSSVFHAIDGFIPEPIQTTNGCTIRLILTSGYTRIPWRGKPADKCPDGPQYKVIGNSMAVPVMAHIGRRIQEVAGL